MTKSLFNPMFQVMGAVAWFIVIIAVIGGYRNGFVMALACGVACMACIRSALEMHADMKNKENE